MERRHILAIVLVSLLFQPNVGTAVAGPDGAPTVLGFGVVPQQSATKLARQWTSVLRHLGERSGHHLRFRTAVDIPVFEQRLAAGEYDIAYMNPYQYAVFHRRTGYAAFAKERDTRLQGLIVVRVDSPLRDLDQLAGLTVAFPAKTAFAASVLPRLELHSREIPVTAKYVVSHDSVYRSVALGLYAAGGGVPRTLATMEGGIRDQLRILWSTRPYQPHAIAAHPRIAPSVVSDLASAMVAMADEPAGKALLAALAFTGIDSARDEDWDDVRQLAPDLALDPVKD